MAKNEDLNQKLRKIFHGKKQEKNEDVRSWENFPEKNCKNLKMTVCMDLWLLIEDNKLEDSWGMPSYAIASEDEWSEKKVKVVDWIRLKMSGDF